MKTCSRCGQEKRVQEFHKEASHSDGLKSTCKACLAPYHKAWRTSNKLKKWAWNLQNRYGVSQVQYEQMLDKQKGVCAICLEPESRMRHGKKSLLCVDHDHATGKIRGLLCTNCNLVLGKANENSDRLLAASNYLTGVVV